MPRCLNCSYILVLIEKRRKYKCAKCGSLFFKKYMEDKEFNSINKNQRKLDREKLFSKRVKLSEEERKRKLKEYNEKNRDRKSDYSNDYYERNRERLLALSKEHYKKVKERAYRVLKMYRKENYEITKYWARIRNLKVSQVNLAIQRLEDTELKMFIPPF